MTDTRKGLENKTRLIEYAPSCALLIHRRAFDQAGFFDPGYFFLYDDWDFSERVRAHGLNIWYAPNARIWHKVSTTTQGPQSPFFWRTFGASIARFYGRHGRPVCLPCRFILGTSFSANSSGSVTGPTGRISGRGYSKVYETVGKPPGWHEHPVTRPGPPSLNGKPSCHEQCQ